MAAIWRGIGVSRKKGTRMVQVEGCEGLSRAEGAGRKRAAGWGMKKVAAAPWADRTRPHRPF